MGYNSKRRYNQTIVGQIGMIIVGATGLMMILFLVAFQSVKSIIITQYSNAAVQSVRAAADNLDYTLQDFENISKSIIFNHELIEYMISGQEEEFLEQLTSYFNSSSNIEGIYVKNDRNYLYVGSNIRDGNDIFPVNELEATSGEIVWIPTREIQIQILSGQIPRDYFSMARKIVDVKSLEEHGYMCIEIDERILQEAYANLREDEAQIYIMDECGNMISSANSDYQEDTPLKHQYMKDILQETASGVLEYTEAGVESVAIYTSFNQGHWRLVKTVPTSALYAEINRVQSYIMFGAFFIFIVILGLGIYFSGQITKPVTRMMMQMKKVEEGNLEVRVDTDSNNELGNLGESFNHMIARVGELMEEVVVAERNKSELELEVLHAQINPHFLYNTLNTIRWMAKLKGEESISNALIALVKLLRVSISVGNSLITLREEISYIESYLLIQRLRFDQSFQIIYEVKQEHENVLIPKLILQPIVENSLIYGMDETKEEDMVIIRVYTQQTEMGVQIVIEDNGPGISEDILGQIFVEDKDIKRFSNVGLNNVNQRIKMYFGEKYGLQIESEPQQGTRVIIWVPETKEEDREDV